MKRQRVKKPVPQKRTQEEITESNSTTAEKLKDEMDEILDEIDEILEENAEEFVKGYVQKGGE